jgi:hypothetical protein
MNICVTNLLIISVVPFLIMLFLLHSITKYIPIWKKKLTNKSNQEGCFWRGGNHCVCRPYNVNKL